MEVRKKEYLSIGLLAHVDAGKTTLSEAILHRTGAIRSAGRVDHGDAFLDTDAMERDRGITIFSKQASFTTRPAERFFQPLDKFPHGRDSLSGEQKKEIGRADSGSGKAFPAGEYVPAAERVWTLVDTPGHADFSTEMERVLQVLDYAVLIVSAADGVTGQVRILWRLLSHYQVPVFIFVNKMDQPGADRAAVYDEIRRELGSACVDLQQALRGCTVSAPGSTLPQRAASGGTQPQNVSSQGKPADTQQFLASDSALFFSQDLQEEIAVCDDPLMESFLEGGEVTIRDAAELVSARKLFPVCFGSALKEEGVDDLLALLDLLAREPARGEAFGARIFKITHDAAGTRLSWMKITGGKLLPRQPIPESPDEKGLPEKASQLRYYRGGRFEALQEAPAGIIAAVPGLSGTYAGQGLGAEAGRAAEQLLQPVMQSRLILPPDQDLYAAYKKLRVLEEEEPMLRLSYDEEKKEITVQIMGQVQREILQRLILERFGMKTEFGEPGIVYRETIAGPVEGVGHFEPLRHYAEVHLLLEPGEPGSGLVFESRCSVNDLALNWQRLILTHLEERRHKGVLTGAEITDMRISILGGRAHAKHTEGGDFRKATYRAVRQGLMMAESVLLEPDYEFRLEIPMENVGRAMADLQQMDASFGQPEFIEKTGSSVINGTVGAQAHQGGQSHGTSVITGTVTVSALGNYAEEVAAYTRGAGSLSCSLRGYVPCKNAQAVIAASGYDPELDVRNPSSSVFCSHGAGTIIPWNEVRTYMHVDTGWRFPEEAPAMTQEEAMEFAAERARQAADSFRHRQQALAASDKELMEIFERTYGPVKPRGGKNTEAASGAAVGTFGYSGRSVRKTQVPRDHYLLVDGYNIIFAWDDLRELALSDIKAARDRLMDILSNFAGSRKEKVILVFDAYKVPGGQGSVQRWHNIDVVFTKEAESADLYIEKTAHVLAKKDKVTVATSDAVEQVIIFGAGALRMSARLLLEEIIYTQKELRDRYGIGVDE